MTEVSFPGGKRDDEDKTLTATALRETKEEIFTDLDEQGILGPFMTMPSKHGSKVTCIVGDLGELDPARMKANPHEVDLIFTVALEWLAETREIENFRLRTSFGLTPGTTTAVDIRDTNHMIPSWIITPDRAVCNVPYQGELKIWGLTGFFLGEFLSKIIYDEELPRKHKL
ncbi:hypothetical protein HDV03_003523 [Kappamyces sp. JEL0829]|nr:hypothetical protein HDV03_003523 [Kappamyces sp. JEL0829]